MSGNVHYNNTGDLNDHIFAYKDAHSIFEIQKEVFLEHDPGFNLFL
jgi:hypothetical protein